MQDMLWLLMLAGKSWNTEECEDGSTSAGLILKITLEKLERILWPYSRPLIKSQVLVFILWLAATQAFKIPINTTGTTPISTEIVSLFFRAKVQVMFFLFFVFCLVKFHLTPISFPLKRQTFWEALLKCSSRFFSTKRRHSDTDRCCPSLLIY